MVAGSTVHVCAIARTTGRQVVAIGEPFELQVNLSDDTIWSPREGHVRYPGQAAIQATRNEQGYRFKIPAQTEPGELRVAVGDARHTIALEPMSRPELTALMARIQFPDYLGHADQQRDVRTGAISIVKGSRAEFQATTSRPLANATINGRQDGVQLSGERLDFATAGG